MRSIFLLLIAGVFFAACADEDVSTTTTQPPSTTSTSSVDITTTTGPVTTTSPGGTVPSTTAAPSTTATTLPGDPIEFGPTSGDRLMVIGVSHDDFLNLRRLPGTAFDVIARIPPSYADLVALGNTRDIGNAFWIEVDFDGVIGWVHLGFIGFEGVTDDLTAFVVDELGERPSAESMTQLAVIVAELFVSEEPKSDVVKVIDETVGDLGEVTYDVIGLGDDAVVGLRLHLFGEPFEDGFALRALEVTYLCGRGASEDGLCV